MAQTEVTVRATTSAAISMQLLAGTAGIDLSAVGTIQMFLRDNAGGTLGFSNVGSGPKLSIPNAAQGSVDFTPGSADLVAGSAPYNGYFKLFVTPATWYFVPEDSELTIAVRETF